MKNLSSKTKTFLSELWESCNESIFLMNMKMFYRLAAMKESINIFFIIAFFVMSVCTCVNSYQKHDQNKLLIEMINEEQKAQVEYIKYRNSTDSLITLKYRIEKAYNRILIEE